MKIIILGAGQVGSTVAQSGAAPWSEMRCTYSINCCQGLSCGWPLTAGYDRFMRSGRAEDSAVYVGM